LILGAKVFRSEGVEDVAQTYDLFSLDGDLTAD